MTDNHHDKMTTLDEADFSLPVTEAFISKVHRGVRRRKMLRVAAGGGAAVAVAGAVSLIFTVASPSNPAPTSNAIGSPVTAAAPSTTADSVQQLLDGYRVTSVPAGLRLGPGGSGAASYPVSKDQLHNDGTTPSAPYATATVTLRMYVKADGGKWLDISVLRPGETTAEVDRAQISQWLTRWALKGSEIVDSYELPAGKAQLTKYVGSEVTAHNVVIAAPDGSVIIVGGSGWVPVADLKAVAAGLLPDS